MGILAKFATIAGGVWIEVKGEADEHGDFDRCFRFDKLGNAEYAYLIDLIDGNPAPRWYGFQAKAKDFILA